MAIEARFGVLVDVHAGRQDGGVPVFWDGWYSERGLAIMAMRAMRERHPGAWVFLIERLDDCEVVGLLPELAVIREVMKEGL